jgi:hypothetical protein
MSLREIATTMGQPREVTGEYVATSQAIPTGKAPKMQVELLDPGEATKQYAVIFYQGDEVSSGLLEFAESITLRVRISRLSRH